MPPPAPPLEPVPLAAAAPEPLSGPCSVLLSPSLKAARERAQELLPFQLPPPSRPLALWASVSRLPALIWPLVPGPVPEAPGSWALAWALPSAPRAARPFRRPPRALLAAARASSCIIFDCDSCMKGRRSVQVTNPLLQMLTCLLLQHFFLLFGSLSLLFGLILLEGHLPSEGKDSLKRLNTRRNHKGGTCCRAAVGWLFAGFPPPLLRSLLSRSLGRANSAQRVDQDCRANKARRACSSES